MCVRDTQIWLTASIYYQRNDWSFLITEIQKFQEQVRNKTNNFFVYYSQERGQNIRIMISASTKNEENLKNQINSYFNYLLINHPSSSSPDSFPYGQILWANYPNNSIIWRESTPHFSDYTKLEYIQITSDMVIQLLDNDTSLDSFFSIGLYLLINILKTGKKKSINIIIEEIIFKINQSFEYYGFLEKIDSLVVDLQINEEEVYEILDIYSNGEEVSPALEHYLSCVKNMFKNQVNFQYISKTIFDLMGLGPSHYLLALELINRWNTRKIER